MRGLDDNLAVALVFSGLYGSLASRLWLPYSKVDSLRRAVAQILFAPSVEKCFRMAEQIDCGLTQPERTTATESEASDVSRGFRRKLADNIFARRSASPHSDWSFDAAEF